MKSTKDLFLILSCMTFTLVLGGAVYEHLAVVPSWSAAPPASLALFHGEYGLKAQYFWISIHPITILLMVGALITNWNTARKKNILTTLIGYVIILAITYVYFVPILLEFIEMPSSDTVDQALVDKASTWEMLSIVRMGFIAVLDFILLTALTRSNAITREVAP